MAGIEGVEETPPREETAQVDNITDNTGNQEELSPPKETQLEVKQDLSIKILEQPVNNEQKTAQQTEKDNGEIAEATPDPPTDIKGTVKDPETPHGTSPSKKGDGDAVNNVAPGGMEQSETEKKKHEVETAIELPKDKEKITDQAKQVDVEKTIEGQNGQSSADNDAVEMKPEVTSQALSDVKNESDLVENVTRTGSILKSRPDTSGSQNVMTPVNRAADANTDTSGHADPHEHMVMATTSQFYPEIPLFRSGSHAENDGMVKKEDSTMMREPGSAMTRGSRAESAAKTVRFDEAGPQVTEVETEDHDYDEEDEEEEDYDGVGSEVTSADSISLPATSPAPSRDDVLPDLFSTQVDEETLEAAKIRQRRRTIILEVEKREPTTPVVPSMEDVLNEKAREHYERGLMLMKRTDFIGAITAFNKCLNLRPRKVDCFVQRAEAFLQLCDFQSAILNYKRACVIEPDNFCYYARLTFIYFFQGQCLFDQKLYPEALEAFSRAAEMRPEVVGYHTRSIACLAALERHGECLALVNRRLESEDRNADLYVMRARLHELFRNATLSYYDVKDALALDPEHREAQVLMKKLQTSAETARQEATQLNLLHRYRDALQKISVAIETNPSQPDYHILRGALHRRLGDFNAAIDDYLLSLDKTDHDEESSTYLEAQRQLLLTYNDFAVECFTKGFYEEAVILLNKAIKGEKREKGLYINRGDCFFQQGNMQFSLADYHQALELDPTDESIKSRIAIVHNEYGVKEYQEKNYKEAESRFSLAIHSAPQTGQYYISRCRARQMMEDISTARTDLIMALHLDPANEELTSVMARLFPGKSVKDIMASRAAASVREALEVIFSNARPIKLQPLERSNGTSEQSGNPKEPWEIVPPIKASTAWKFPSVKMCMLEKDFHIKIVKEKKKVAVKIKGILNNRKSLRTTAGRVQALPEPAPYERRSPNPLKHEKVMVHATKGGKSTGWKKFSLGIGVSAVPDVV